MFYVTCLSLCFLICKKEKDLCLFHSPCLRFFIFVEGSLDRWGASCFFFQIFWRSRDEKFEKHKKKNDENHSSSSVCDDGRGNVKIDRDKDGKSNHWCTYDTVERFG